MKPPSTPTERAVSGWTRTRESTMRIWTTALPALAFASTLGAQHASAQVEVRKLSLKSGESVEIDTVYWTVNCKSIMIGLPAVEVLQGPPAIALSIKEERVLPLRVKCPAKVPGGILMLTAKDVTEPAEAKLTYRLKYKTMDGDRQRAGTYIISLQP